MVNYEVTIIALIVIFIVWRIRKAIIQKRDEDEYWRVKRGARYY